MYKLIVDDFEKLIEEMGEYSNKVSQHFYPVLDRHSRPCDDSIFGDNRRTVRMLVTIRTDRTDEVLVPTDGKFYTECTQSYPNEHPLYDTVLLAAKSLVDSMFDCGDDIQKVIVRTSLYLVGVCVVNEQVYVYVNVIIDHTLKDEEFFVLKDCTFESIKKLIPCSPLEEDMISKLILVKGDK